MQKILQGLLKGVFWFKKKLFSKNQILTWKILKTKDWPEKLSFDLKD